MTFDPARDCPACPSCGLNVATPIVAAAVERWDGPADATLFCPACGRGWCGTPADLERAEAAWSAYETEMAEQAR